MGLLWSWADGEDMGFLGSAYGDDGLSGATATPRGVFYLIVVLAGTFRGSRRDSSRRVHSRFALPESRHQPAPGGRRNEDGQFWQDDWLADRGCAEIIGQGAGAGKGSGERDLTGRSIDVKMGELGRIRLVA